MKELDGTLKIFQCLSIQEYTRELSSLRRTIWSLVFEDNLPGCLTPVVLSSTRNYQLLEKLAAESRLALKKMKYKEKQLQWENFMQLNNESIISEEEQAFY